MGKEEDLKALRSVKIVGITIGLILGYLIFVRPMFFVEAEVENFCLDKYGTEEVAWANPMWFSCESHDNWGSKDDYYRWTMIPNYFESLRDTGL